MSASGCGRVSGNRQGEKADEKDWETGLADNRDLRRERKQIAEKYARQGKNDMNTPVLETERLILRKFTEKDMEALFLVLRDEKANRFLPWFPVKNMEETRKFYEERYAAKYRQPQAYAYAVCLKSDNVPIGYMKVDMEEHHDFGYGLRKEFWHRGIAREAGRAVIGQVEKDGLPYVTATHDVRNPRSGRVMEALGMSYRYSYEEMWQPKNFPVTFRLYQLNFDGNEGFVYKKYWNMSSNHFVEELPFCRMARIP